ncbi:MULTISPECIES: PilW family protein [unclassified Francisella]|uniref:PilW family protein n=1 Tax=unclassified Francisella TaxID=2610885 RepID=UPI002E37D232|nr:MULTISPECIES: prepilin-type N-terminal cleavage/methylation domain-containing protein [unclassified Francisella]MED7818778.1 prepilin-type N-terminal cleavage/methylation domain-containing protein [Francisella sp. 19S2-4]MED7829614.1 prepilin-type N-terminal cleavage/methylation domain-containing protein [Francisella sp. 19S2-10]
MKLRFRKDKISGFTLISLLISTAISMIVVAALITSYITVKNKYNLYKSKTEIETKELLVKNIVYDFVKDVGFACKFGYFNQDYYDSTSDSLDNFFYTSSMLRVGSLPLTVSNHIPGALESDCSGECYQKGTDYIMVKKEDSHTEFNTINALDTTLGVKSINNISTGDYLFLCNRNAINLVRVSSINEGTNTVGLSRAPQSAEYYPGDYIGKYSLEILYIRDTGQKDDNGQSIYSLYVYIKDSASTGMSYELVRGVSDLQVEYATVNGGNTTWNSITSDTAIDTSAYPTLRVSFNVDGKSFSKIINL